MAGKFVSIVIPTYNDWAGLSKCLKALSMQSYPSGSFEIIVANNNPSNPAPLNYRLPDNCQIITESKPGSYAARNSAIKKAKGEIIGFTDSDCIPDKDWITNAVASFNHNPDLWRVAGHIELFYKKPELSNVELYEKIFAFNQDLYVKKDSSAVTANLFTYKSAFEKVGLFNDELMSGGDYEWSVRAKNGDLSIKYFDNVTVLHPARYEFAELERKARRVGGGQAKFAAGKPSNLLSLVYDLRPPIKTIPIINQRGKTLSINQKLVVFFIRYRLNLITAFEKYRVKAGKIAARE
ncbi:glycosyltransferase [Mucilaginibacter agri]|uniref:Glycosyltransferase n=1 Tax=Mucilaginibacter agri TaxID=2695265 RepID=A0A966DWD4_9SPHI|nr:glycosyltransferase family 2 protein [Mucilaginibacter agri]NCD72397.1 glycosyltransferase [Mucilaginibacter agri]